MEQEIYKKGKIYSTIEIDYNKLSTQNKIKIQGIPIYFPYKPYPPQILYMEKVISALNKKGSLSALESPTGTGKTLCLLCAILAWMKYYNKKISIYYCTRTVSQINNLLKELNKTCYKINTSFIASRKHTCLKFTKSEKYKMDNTQLRYKCDKLRDNIFKKKTSNIFEKTKQICEYYKTFNDYKDLKMKNEFEDIEDLLKEGKKGLFCPYFYNIFRTRFEANLTIMTYNYILNPYIRCGLNVVEKNSIIILDEAHNICDNFENYDSNKINTNDLEKIQKLLQILLDFSNQNRKEIYDKDEEINPIFKINTNDLNNEINNIKKLMENIKDIKELNVDKFKKYNHGGQSKRESYIVDIEFLKEKFKSFKAKLYNDITKEYNSLNDEENILLNNFYEGRLKYDKNKIELSHLIKLIHKLNEFLNLLGSFILNQENDDSLPPAPIISDNSENLENKEIIILKNKEEIYSFRFIFSKDENQSIFEILCIDPSFGLKEYLKLKPYATFLTSGTLSINSIENLLNIKFDEKLNNSHVINNNQFMINIINGYEKYNVPYNYSFTYKNKNNIYQIRSLGHEIFNLANSVKIGGVLVFFQSFEYLNKCYTIWLEEKVIQKYETIKDVFFDLSFNRDYSQETIMDLKKKNNLLLFTVYRGINSEGINFPNDEARMVICVGVPFQNLSDIKVQLKRDFLDERNKKENNGFNGQEWYREDAINAANQALGRLIRNVNDYGIMICFGKEFIDNMRYFTKWMRNNNMETVFLKEDSKDYYNKLNTFLTDLRGKYTNINNFENKSYDENDEIDYSEVNADFEEKEDYFDNNEGKDKFSFSLEKSNSKSSNPYIGYKRYRDRGNDDNH